MHDADRLTCTIARGGRCGGSVQQLRAVETQGFNSGHRSDGLRVDTPPPSEVARIGGVLQRSAPWCVHAFLTDGYMSSVSGACAKSFQLPPGPVNFVVHGMTVVFGCPIDERTMVV